MIGHPGPHVLNEPRRWRGQGGAGTLEKAGGNVWEVGKEGAGSGIPKEEDSGRNRKVVDNVTSHAKTYTNGYPF